MAAVESSKSVFSALPPPPRARQNNRRARRLANSSASAYDKDLANFKKLGGSVPADPAAVLRYIEVLRKRVTAVTAYRRCMALQRAHADAGLESPTDDAEVRTAIRWLQAGRFPPKSGAKATPAELPAKRAVRSAKPLTRALLERCEEALGRSMLDRRDRALLVLGFMAALKRQQLVSLDVQDLSFADNALFVVLRHPDGSVRRKIALATTGGPLCPAAACRQYIEHLALPPESPLFASFNRAGEPTADRLSAAFVSVVVKRALGTIGIDAKDYSGESLRKGRQLEAAKGTL